MNVRIRGHRCGRLPSDCGVALRYTTSPTPA